MSWIRRCRFQVKNAACEVISITIVLAVGLLIWSFLLHGHPLRLDSSQNLIKRGFLSPNNELTNATKRYLTITKDAYERTGNLLFKYATLVGLAHRYGMTAVLKSDESILEILDGDSLSKQGFVTIVSSYDWSVVDWTIARETFPCSYSLASIELALKTEQYVRLVGYFQSWRYFDNEQELVFSRLLYRDNHVAALNGELKRLTKMAVLSDIILQHSSSNTKQFNQSNRLKLHTVVERRKHVHLRQFLGIKSDLKFVAVHIRRGDLLYDSSAIQYGYRLPSETYFKNAIRFVLEHVGSSRDDLVFLVSSDEPAYAKRVAAFWNVQTVFLEGNEPIVDLLLLAACDHTVMSVGSFGWWAAYLKRAHQMDAFTVYYAKPYAKDSQLEKDFNSSTTDYYPNDWFSIGG